MLLCYCGTAFGWGKSGHDAIAYIAECNLTPKAKKNIEKYYKQILILSKSISAAVRSSIMPRGWMCTAIRRLTR